MNKTLVVVESPAKAKTIKKYLGAGFDVKASVGHVKDLPTTPAKDGKAGPRKKSGHPGAIQKSPVLGVDVANGFTPDYRIIPGKEKILRGLREAAEKASRVLLATDPDREGEAIAWHVSQE
ncbi:MAG: toprim domain-containing protein [Deltaproteobacteria bacterium]